MVISNIKQVVCDYCSCGIDYFESATNRIVNKILVETGAIVQGRKHFCGDRCYESWKKNGGAEE